MKLTSFLLLVTLTSISAADVKTSIGAMSIKLNPAIFGEIEYGFSKKSIRVGFGSRPPIMGDSRYQTKYADFTFYSSNNMSETYETYLSVGDAVKSKRGVDREEHRIVGIGFKNSFYKNIFANTRLNLFYKAGLNKTNIHYLLDNRRDILYIPFVAFGAQF